MNALEHRIKRLEKEIFGAAYEEQQYDDVMLKKLREIVQAHGVSKRIPSKLPRWLHEFWAHFNGYFWIPCPTCYRPVGGHEANGCAWLSNGKGKMICTECDSILKKYGHMWRP